MATPYLAGIGCSAQHRAELGTISHGGGAGPDLRHLTSLSELSHLLGARLAICPGRGEVGEGFSWSRCPVPCSRFFQPLEKPAADCLANARGSDRRLAPQPSSTVGRSWASVPGEAGPDSALWSRLSPTASRLLSTDTGPPFLSHAESNVRLLLH